MTRALRQIPTLLTAFGAALPGASKDHRGQFAWLRASATEDEIHAGVVDSSNVPQWRRLLTKTYADTLYLTPAVAAATYQPILPIEWLHPMQGTFKQDSAVVGGTTFAGVGQTALTVAATASNQDTTDGAWVRSTTGTTSGNAAGFTGHADGIVRYQWAPSVVFVIKTDSTGTSIREWVGLFNSDPSGSADGDGITGVGFRHDTGEGDTNWMGWRNNGVSTGTLVDTGVAYTAGQAVRLAIHIDPVSGIDAHFFVSTTDDAGSWSTVASITGAGDLPTSASLTRYARVTTLTNAARHMALSRISHYHER